MQKKSCNEICFHSQWSSVFKYSLKKDESPLWILFLRYSATEYIFDWRQKILISAAVIGQSTDFCGLSKLKSWGITTRLSPIQSRLICVKGWSRVAKMLIRWWKPVIMPEINRYKRWQTCHPIQTWIALLVHVALELGSPRSCNLLIKVYMFNCWVLWCVGNLGFKIIQVNRSLLQYSST